MARGVYVVGFADYVKIGWSVRIGKRLRELELGTPEELTLYLIFPDAARTFEKELHGRFSDYRIRNEWFYLGGELFEYLKRRSIEPIGETGPEAPRLIAAMSANRKTAKIASARTAPLHEKRGHLELVK